MGSSGAMWSEETKQRLLSYNKGMMLIDSFSSSEALGMGMSITTADGSVHTGKFQLSEATRLFSEGLELLNSKPGMKGLVGVNPWVITKIGIKVRRPSWSVRRVVSKVYVI